MAGIDGEALYGLAVQMTDAYGRRFQDMVVHDLGVSLAERKYFVDDFADVPLLGWNKLCLTLQEQGDGDWLNKILRLDEDVLLGQMERRLLDALEGRVTDTGLRIIDRDALDASAKAIQGLVGRSKILTEQRNAAVSNNEIIIKIIESKHDSDVPGGICEALAREGSNGGRTGTD